VILPSLVDSTAKNFTMKEISANTGYSGGSNHDAIAKVGALLSYSTGDRCPWGNPT
jgi:hypothetical protein